MKESRVAGAPKTQRASINLSSENRRRIGFPTEDSNYDGSGRKATPQSRTSLSPATE